jgi:hypothetical protein
MGHLDRAAAVLVTAAVAAACSREDSRLAVRVVDDASGQPVAARVFAADRDGAPLEIEGTHEHVQHVGRRWCYVGGSFALDVPPEGAAIEVRRGLETRPLSVTVRPGGAGERTLRLRRWADLHARGLVSGDAHAHAPSPRDAELQMRAEDLHVANLLALNGSDFPANSAFTGRLDPVSGGGHDVSVGQEVQDWQSGHLTLLGLRSLVPGYPGPGGTLEYWRSEPHWDVGRAARAARAQGGFVSWSHFENLPGAYSPVAVALGLLDAIELVTWSDPTQLPSHWGPWNDSGLPMAEFTVMRGVDLYYQFLNAGFRVPIAAGTDKLGEDVPLGGNRAYVPAKAPFGHADWLEGVKEGRGFVTNGPILEFDVDGHGPGERVGLGERRRATARATARSILPFTTLAIVANGRTVARKIVPPPANPPVDGVWSMSVEAPLDLDRSAWVAARVTDDVDLNPRVLPRGASVFAHTNAVHFVRDGRAVREEASVAYLRKWVGGLRHWLSTRPSFATEEDRQSLERDAAEAARILESL